MMNGRIDIMSISMKVIVAEAKSLLLWPPQCHTFPLLG